ESLRRSAKDPKTAVYHKANSLLERAKAALENKTELKLQTSSKSGTQAEKEELVATDRVLPTATGIKRGDMRLHLVFQSSQQLSDEVAMMVQTIPRFKAWESANVKPE